MERIKIRTQSLLTQMVAQTSRADLSANETKSACVLPSRPRPACRSNRPDTYQRLPVSNKFSLANSSRSIHLGHQRTSAYLPNNVRLQIIIRRIAVPANSYNITPNKISCAYLDLVQRLVGQLLWSGEAQRTPANSSALFPIDKFFRPIPEVV